MFKKLLYLIFSLTIFFQLTGVPIVASTPANSGSLIDDLNKNLKRQEELKNQIKNAQSQQKTLASQITYMENQIELTSLEIEETNQRLGSLADEIAQATQKLADAEQNFDHLVYVKDTRVRNIYKESFSNGPLEVLLSSDSVNEILLKQKYADAVHQSDLELMNQLKETRDNIDAEKRDLEKKKSDEENLKASLVNKQNSLASQKSQKAYLLEVTKNDEANYQRLLAQARLDQQAIQAALSLQDNKLGPVSRGDIIAFQGNTGCSTGTHLHFGYIVNGVSVDPAPYLNNGSLGRPESIGAPYFPSLSQYNSNPSYWYSVGITQPFGANPGLFPGYQNGHPAIDMTAGWNAPIRAVKSGIAYLAGDSGCPSLLPGTGPGKGIIIDHGDGTKTLYWHIR